MTSETLLARLERYTVKHPQEVLLVTATVKGESEQIMVFKGFSSSLMKPTAFDPDIPVLSSDAVIIAVDRLQAPYHPTHPYYLQQNLTAAQVDALLVSVGF